MESTRSSKEYKNFCYSSPIFACFVSFVFPGTLSLQQIHRLAHVMHPEILSQGRMASGHCLIHSVSNFAIGAMSSRRGSQLGDVERFGKIHFEQGALFERQRKKVLGALLGFRAASMH